jgi:two-component system, OmpR family, sensor kinase
MVGSFGGSGVRDSLDRVGRWLGGRLGEAWTSPEALQVFTTDTAAALGAHLDVYYADGRRVAQSPGACRGRPLHLPVTRGAERLGSADLCWDGPSGRHDLWILSAVVALLAFWAVAGRVARRIARPLIELSTVVRRIGDGDLDARAELSCGAPDEVGVVAQAVNEMAGRLQQQNASQKKLLASVSHELRTPLSRIRLISELARSEGAASTAMDELDREVADIDSLVGQLLASSRLDFGQLSNKTLSARDVALRALERAGVDADRLVVVERASASASASNDTFSADPTLLQRALANLLDNARKHGGGVDVFHVDATGTTVRFEVRDRGPGLATPAEKLFVPFSTARSSTREDGLGLGLALVKRIAEAHGGTVWARTRADGGAEVGFEVARNKSDAPGVAG